MESAAVICEVPFVSSLRKVMAYSVCLSLRRLVDESSYSG